WIEHTCVNKKGKLIIPAFSVGRTQELLYFLNQLELEKRLPPVEYIVDSPLSKEVTMIVKAHHENFNDRLQDILDHDEDPFKFKGMRFTKTVEESKQLNFKREPCVIISASGMAEAGRIKHHISNNIENSRNTILMVGYAEPNSLGGRLKRKPKEVSIFGMKHEVHAEIAEMDSMSAHADYDDMLQWLECQDPKKVKKIYLVHGEYEVQQQFAMRLERKGFRHVEIPARHETFDIS
ncbi:MAG TPA: MBL fold metallo-hydrolase RNA specificity domain-containing protein, partial [Phnomibacter sp.]|nr:MBL fold metallo-hydrolase RNA specificity domain-containing protein [Phnomibacter sp.]